MNLELVEKAKEGDEISFNQLIEQNKYKIYKTAKSILKDEDDVCDAIQEALIRAYNNINKLEKNEYFTTWIIRIVINKCYDIAKANQKKNPKVVEFKEAETIQVYDKYNESVLEQVLKKLDDDLKTVTVLYYYDDLAIKDIAKILNIPGGTVKSKLSRARNKLYEMLREEEV